MNARRIIAVIRKETHEIVRDPVTIWISLLMPLVMLFLFGYAISLDVKDIRFGVWDGDGSPASRDLAETFTRSGYFALVRRFDNERELAAALRKGEIKMALVIPEDFSKRLVTGARTTVQIIVDGTFSNTAQIAGAYADAIILSGANAPHRLVTSEVRVWYNPEMRSVNYVVPGLFGVILLAFPPLLTTLAVVREKETGSIQQIFASPLTSAEFIAGKLVPYGVLAFVQVLLVMGFGLAWFKVPFRGGIGLLLGVSLLYVLCTVGLGLLVSTLTRKQVVAMLMAMVLTLMPSFLFSGFLFPIFTMPYFLQWYAAAFPGQYFIELSRDVVMKGAGLADVWRNVAALSAYTVVVFCLAAWRFRKKVA